MLSFGSGPNMCTGRLRGRLNSAEPGCKARLANPAFRFHKRTRQTPFFPGEREDVVWGIAQQNMRLRTEQLVHGG